MNLPILQSEVKTMSSREIATLCEKEHKNVIRDIRNMLDSLDGSLLNHEYYQILTDERGYTSEILLNENLSINLVTGYNPTLRLRMVQHWQELRKPKELSRMELIELAMQAERERIALAIENQTLKPKADAYDRFLDSDGLMTSGVIGKLLGYKSAQEFNDAIHAKGVAFKSSGVWQFYASFKDKHIGKMVGWEREEFNKAGVTLKWKTVAIDYFSSLLGRQVVQKELLDA